MTVHAPHSPPERLQLSLSGRFAYWYIPKIIFVAGALALLVHYLMFSDALPWRAILLFAALTALAALLSRMIWGVCTIHMSEQGLWDGDVLLPWASIRSVTFVGNSVSNVQLIVRHRRRGVKLRCRQYIDLERVDPRVIAKKILAQGTIRVIDKCRPPLLEPAMIPGGNAAQPQRPKNSSASTSEGSSENS